MKRSVDHFACFNGTPAFAASLAVGQDNLPDPKRLADAISGIFERRYFANHGPLVSALERQLADAAGAGYAICVVNEFVAVMILAQALEWSGAVALPALVTPDIVYALRWAGLDAVYSDIDPVSSMSVSQWVEAQAAGMLVLDEGAPAHGIKQAATLAESQNLALIVYRGPHFGDESAERFIRRHARASVCSLGSGALLNAAEGGVIFTEDPVLAARARTIRNFHPSHTYADVTLRINGKMSEAQAALALLNLEEMPVNVAANRSRIREYARYLRGIRGVRFVERDMTHGDCATVFVEIDPYVYGLDAGLTTRLLLRENVQCLQPYDINALPGLDAGQARLSFPNAAARASRLLQLPNSQAMNLDDVARVCELVAEISQFAPEITERIGGAP